MTNTDQSYDPTDITPLLTAWQSHQELREQGASVRELMVSRHELDSTRLDVRSNLDLAS